jgi:hypothetical protein
LLRARLAAMRGEIIRKLQRDVPVEKGAWRVRLCKSESRRLTSTNLSTLLGYEEVERMKELVPPTISVSLKIECAK